MKTPQEKFEQWAIIQLSDGWQLIGLVSEQLAFGTTFARVDVPATTTTAAFTRLFPPDKIYSITLCDEHTKIIPQTCRFCHQFITDIKEILQGLCSRCSEL